MFRRILVLTAAAATILTLCVGAATAARGMLIGIYEEGQTIFGDPDKSMPTFKALRVQVLRTNLYWGGHGGVANRRPAKPTDPNDPAYDWSIYDRTIKLAARNRIRMMLAVYGTPRWANGGKSRNYAPRNMLDLSRFVRAAATRYSGRFKDETGETLPAVRFWLAWNEPNQPTFLKPQFRRSGRRYVVESPRLYARICNSVVSGVKSVSRANKVGCGVTSPRGNNAARTGRASLSPLVFLRNMKRFGARGFDAYAHHPYPVSRSEKPTSRPKSKTAVTLGNINDLVRAVTRYYGRKPIWITEYGYQTRPPDRFLGVSYANQAKYLRQAYTIARKNPRIGMMLWFLLRDEPGISGWQSGFFSASGKRKPAYTAFQRLPR